MRKNTKNVFNAWLNNRSERKQKSIWTDGKNIYSYNTIIIQMDIAGYYVMNMQRYSCTTSNHQNSLRIMIHHHYPDTHRLDYGNNP